MFNGIGRLYCSNRSLGMNLRFFFLCSKKELLFHKHKGEIMMNFTSINKNWIHAIERDIENKNISQFQDVESKKEPLLVKYIDD